MEQAKGDRSQNRQRGRQFARGLNTAVTGNAHAFGFSITVTTSYGAVSVDEGSPSLPELVGFALAAVAAFAILNMVVAGTASASGSTTSRTLLIGTATDFLAVGAGLGVAIALGQLLDGWLPWVLAAFGAALVYVLVQAVEMTVGRRETEGDDQ